MFTNRSFLTSHRMSAILCFVPADLQLISTNLNTTDCETTTCALQNILTLKPNVQYDYNILHNRMFSEK